MKLVNIGSVLLSFGVALSSASPGPGGNHGNPRIGKKNDIASCLASARVETISPTSPAYNTSIVSINSEMRWFPAAMAVPANEFQVSSAVKCARQYGLKVQALAGGHSFAAYGLGGQNGSLVINLKKFKDISVNKRTNTASVGAGQRLGDIALALYENGKRDIPHGVCGGVGIGGHATHGGFGYASRLWGVTLDTVYGMDVVLADGSIKYVDAQTDPDLFWALRGAGDSFGIVTKFHVKTYLAPTIGTIFNFTFPSLKTPEDRVAVFTALQDYAITASEKFHMRLSILPNLGPMVPNAPGPEGIFVVSGVYWGPQTTYESVIAPLVSRFPADTNHFRTELPYLRALESFDNYAPLKQADPYFSPSTSFYIKSLESPAPLTVSSQTAFFNFLAGVHANAETPVFWNVALDLAGGVHSKIKKYSLDSASYAGRDTLWSIQFYSTPITTAPPYPEEGYSFLKDMVDSIKEAQPETAFTAYPNAVDPELKKEEALRLYYGPQLERLKRIKRKVDKGDLFWNPQSVSVARR